MNLQWFAEETAEAVEAVETPAVETPAVETVQETVPEVSREAVPAPYQAMEPVLDALAQRLGVESGNGEALLEAMRREREDAKSRRMQQGAEQIYTGWMRDAEQLKQVYPDFDLRRELQNPRFAQLLRSQVDMQTAFEVLHNREIIPAAMEYAARTVQEKLAGSMRRGVDRPVENGIRGSGAVMVGNDVSRMSRKDYAAICRMVERGERVSFG